MYLDYFDLKEMPFNITPDPRFLFFSDQHKRAFDHLIYGIEFRKGFIELTGEVGSGKTTLCRAVLAGLPRSVHTALVLNPCLSETQLVRAVLNDFGLEVQDRDRLSQIEQLNEFLLAQNKQGNNVALIIDEAQDLNPEVLEEIRLLSNLETDQHKLIQIVLAGQPELHERLARPEFRQLRQRVIVSCHLRPLSEVDTAQYIAHRLAVAGGSAEVAFDEEGVSVVYNKSGGIPRLINNICDNAMLAAYIDKRKLIGGDQVRKAISYMESGS
ncbi:MAG: AAA family ATPase [Lentisphaerota bacterium]